MPGFKPSGKPCKTGSGHDAPPNLSGGHWVMIHGHPVYLRDGTVHSGGIAGVTHHADGRVRGTVAVDHGALAARVATNAKPRGLERSGDFAHRFERGPARSRADHEHVARASSTGRAAIAIESAPQHAAVADMGHPVHHEAPTRPVPARPGGTHHFVGGEPVASVFPQGGKHAVAEYRVYKPIKASGRESQNEYNLGETVHVHRTEAKAREHADRLVARAVKEGTKVDRISTLDPGVLDVAARMGRERHRTHTLRVIDPG